MNDPTYVMTRKTQSVTAARQRLRAAIDRACVARGEAQWTNGYRTARRSGGAESEREDESLHRKEMLQFKFCGNAEANAERAMRAYALAIKRDLEQP